MPAALRVCFLWSHLSGYMNVMFEEIARHGGEVFVSHFSNSDEAPVAHSMFDWINTKNRVEWPEGKIDGESLQRSVLSFDPDILLVSGWSHKEYLRLAAGLRGSKTIRILAMDNQWRATPRQQLGVRYFKLALRSKFDLAFVPGERQREFASRLGFAAHEIVDGLFPSSRSIESASSEAPGAEKRSFLYVGRLSPEKGIELLLRAYASYRATATSPWNLTVAGTGPMSDRVRAANVDYRGFVQSEALPELFAAAGAFVMPSSFEQWGVAIQEAASAGLPIICTNACGAAVHLVRPHFNGYLFDPKERRQLELLMRKLSTLSERELLAMRLNSRRLAGQYSAPLWVNRLASAVSIYQQSSSKIAP